MNATTAAQGLQPKAEGRRTVTVFVAGILVGCGLVGLLGSLVGGAPGRLGAGAGSGPHEGLLGLVTGGLIHEAQASLQEGDYEFYPNRRSVWVVNRTNGRMANYNFRHDEVGSVDRSRVATIDLTAFPREDTVIQLSDKNLNNVLWICNVRTGDVQLWYPASDGSLHSDPPVATSMDLRERQP